MARVLLRCSGHFARQKSATSSFYALLSLSEMLVKRGRGTSAESGICSPDHHGTDANANSLQWMEPVFSESQIRHWVAVDIAFKCGVPVVTAGPTLAGQTPCKGSRQRFTVFVLPAPGGQAVLSI